MNRIFSSMLLCAVMIISVSNAADNTPQSPEEIESWWKDGKTLPIETTALYPLREQRVKDDTGINVLIDMSHKCDFFTLWNFGSHLNNRGFRTIGSHATLDSVLNTSTPSRV